MAYPPSLAMGGQIAGLHPAWSSISSPLVSHVCWDAGGAEDLGTAFPSSLRARVPVVEGGKPSQL